MEVPLTPLEFARRSRALYSDREAVVDGALRLTYAQFFDRCDRWSSALQALGVKPGDRVAYIAPNTHAQLESFYAVPQTGAVLVPLNFRLIADDFRYLINHSGSKIVCAHADYLECIDGIRGDLPGVEQFVALTGSRPGWLDYEALVREAHPLDHWPAPVRVRIGLHTGTAALGEDGYVGVEVHRAFRIANAGHGGQIVCSEPAALVLTPGRDLRDLGLWALPELPEPELPG